jgi:hypothetical protein
MFDVNGETLADLIARDPQEAAIQLRICDETLQQLVSKERMTRFKQSFFADDTDVNTGLTQAGPYGHYPLRDRPEFLPDGKAAVTRAAEKVSARLEGRRRTLPEDIRAGVAAPDARDIRSGLTQHGRPVSLDDASGATERWKREQEDQRRRAHVAFG